MTKLTVKLFNNDEMNALLQAFRVASGEEHIYEWLNHIPETSMVVQLVLALKKIGYQIKPIE